MGLLEDFDNITSKGPPKRPPVRGMIAPAQRPDATFVANRTPADGADKAYLAAYQAAHGQVPYGTQTGLGGVLSDEQGSTVTDGPFQETDDATMAAARKALALHKKFPDKHNNPG